MASMDIKKKTLCIDFDGTIVGHKFPEIGDPVPGAIDTMIDLYTNGHKIILYTMRSGKTLDAAVEYLKQNGVEPWGVNVNPTQKSWSQSPKVFGHIYIDDAALGCPLIQVPNDRPYVDWVKIRELLVQEGVL